MFFTSAWIWNAPAVSWGVRSPPLIARTRVSDSYGCWTAGRWLPSVLPDASVEPAKKRHLRKNTAVAARAFAW